MTPWHILAVGLALAFLLGVLLQHRVEMTKTHAAIPADEYERGRIDGMDAAAKIVESDVERMRWGREFASMLRAANRTRGRAKR